MATNSQDPLRALVRHVGREIRGSWRYKWQALLCAWFVCAASWAGIYLMPDVYEASARVFVDTNSRLRDVLGTIAFDPDIDARVNVVRQAMLGRPQLEKVADMTGITTGDESDEAHELAIAQLAESIAVETGRSQADRNLFRISYQNSERERSIAVVSALLDTFVQDVLQQKQEGGAVAQRFLADQVEYYREQLALADQKLAEFKRENIGLLPGDEGDYFRDLAEEERLLQTQRTQLRVLESRYNELQRQLNQETPVIPASDSASSLIIPGANDIGQRILALEAQIDDYLLRYTDAHPDVVYARDQLARLREEQQRQLSLNVGTGALANSNNPVYQALQISLNETGVQIAAMRTEIGDRETRIAGLRDMLEVMPQIEAELARLTRDYGNYRSLFEQLSDQLERERLVSVGDEEEVVTFQVIDPPIAEADPIAPRRGLLIFGALILGGLIGGALAYALNLLNPVFVDPRQIQEILGLPVVGVISVASLNMLAGTRSRSFATMAAGLVVCGVIVYVLRAPGSALMQQLLNIV